MDPGGLTEPGAGLRGVRKDGGCPLQRLAYHDVRDEGVPDGAKLRWHRRCEITRTCPS